ncbi:glycerophosphodiester phosphodiesterase family protein [Paenibacillus lautus]|uniref:glycerophosphodiester phosphodiesterase family protein n=1 Tax=Paenibacillus lautus TaxID=1401 RepID=UPI003D26A2A4
MIGKYEYGEINHLLQRKLDAHGVLIAVHRGSSGGNIIENTIPAYKVALKQGGDMLEVDVVKSTDGKLYTFHDGQERKLLHRTENIKTMSSQEIESLTYFNSIYHQTSYKVETLKDVLSYFKGDTLINIDRGWDIWPEVLELLDQSDMTDQILLKGPVTEEHLQFLNDYPTKYMFMPIVHTMEQIDTVLQYPHINLVGMELIADTEAHPLFQDEVIERLHNLNLFVWANAINLDDVTMLFARLDDDTSLMQSPDHGWGRLIDKKIDVIQTDWPALLSAYRTKKWKS